MKEAHDRAEEILSSRRDQMDLMASVLLERETIDGEACQALLNNRWDEYLQKEKQEEQAKKLAEVSGDVANTHQNGGQNDAGSGDFPAPTGQPAVPAAIQNGQPMMPASADSVPAVNKTNQHTQLPPSATNPSRPRRPMPIDLVTVRHEETEQGASDGLQPAQPQQPGQVQQPAQPQQPAQSQQVQQPAQPQQAQPAQPQQPAAPHSAPQSPFTGDSQEGNDQNNTTPRA